MTVEVQHCMRIVLADASDNSDGEKMSLPVLQRIGSFSFEWQGCVRCQTGMSKVVKRSGLQIALATLAVAISSMAVPADARSFREALRERAKEMIRENEKKESSARGSLRSRKETSEKRSQRPKEKSSDRDKRDAKETERNRRGDHRRDDDEGRELYYRYGGGYTYRYNDPFGSLSWGATPAPYFAPHVLYDDAPPQIIIPARPSFRYYSYAEPYQRPRVIYRGVRPQWEYSGDVAVQVQSRLSGLGYYRGAIDGIIGGGTRRAIRAFQIDHGLPVSGRIDSFLLRALRVRNFSL